MLSTWMLLRPLWQPHSTTHPETLDRHAFHCQLLSDTMPPTHRFASTLLHVCAASCMAWGYTEMSRTAFDAWIREQGGGRWQFLTIQGLALAWTTMVIGTAEDVFPRIPGLRSLKRISGLVTLPLAFLISLIYWSLILFAPNLIMSEQPSEGPPSSMARPNFFRLPLAVDVCLHGLPAIALFADFFLFEHAYSRTTMKRGAPLAAIGMAIEYALWVERCAKTSGFYPYPFLNHPPGVRISIYTCCTALSIAFMWMLNASHPGRPFFGATSHGHVKQQ
ncbi:FAR-17a/AIG1-like protein-domain-containing protein [Gloeopeniophorella convolvens]|nr:FAR-17a/AIG1-like protein-domain-containing protein [Gloeopeniophorella convolvens]